MGLGAKLIFDNAYTEKLIKVPSTYILGRTLAGVFSNFFAPSVLNSSKELPENLTAYIKVSYENDMEKISFVL